MAVPRERGACRVRASPESEPAAAATRWAGQGYRPKTQKFETWIIPSGGGVVRNMMPTRDGRGLALAESGVNGLALVSIH